MSVANDEWWVLSRAKINFTKDVWNVADIAKERMIKLLVLLRDIVVIDTSKILVKFYGYYQKNAQRIIYTHTSYLPLAFKIL